MQAFHGKMAEPTDDTLGRKAHIFILLDRALTDF